MREGTLLRLRWVVFLSPPLIPRRSYDGSFSTPRRGRSPLFWWLRRRAHVRACPHHQRHRLHQPGAQPLADATCRDREGQRLYFRNGLEKDEPGGRVRKERAGPACLQGEVGRRNAPLTAAAPLGCRLYCGNGRPQLGIWDRRDYPRSAVTKLASDPAALLLAVHYTVRWFFIDGMYPSEEPHLDSGALLLLSSPRRGGEGGEALDGNVSNT